MKRTPSLERPESAFVHDHIERVRFGDTDAAGIVYYATYLRYFEAGRAELMRAAGLPYAQVVEAGLFMPVAETWARYHRPAVYDDEITVRSWVHEVRAASILVGTEIWRGDTLLAEGGTRLACVDRQGALRRIPEPFKAYDPRARAAP